MSSRLPRSSCDRGTNSGYWLPGILPTGSAGRFTDPRRRRSRAAGLPRSARADGRHRRQRLGLEPEPVPGRRHEAAPRAARVRARRRPRPRAARMADLLRRHHLARRPGRRHVPRLLDAAASEPVGVVCGARRAFNQLHARIAVSEAAAWTGRRWFGGEYEVIPNGVDLTRRADRPEDPRRRAQDPLRRPARGAQRTSCAALRLSGARRARPGAADADRRRRPRPRSLPRRPRVG